MIVEHAPPLRDPAQRPADFQDALVSIEVAVDDRNLVAAVPRDTLEDSWHLVVPQLEQECPARAQPFWRSFEDSSRSIHVVFDFAMLRIKLQADYPHLDFLCTIVGLSIPNASLF